MYFGSSILAGLYLISHLTALSCFKKQELQRLETAFCSNALPKAGQHYSQSKALCVSSRNWDVPPDFAWEVYVDYRPETSC